MYGDSTAQLQGKGKGTPTHIIQPMRCHKLSLLVSPSLDASAVFLYIMTHGQASALACDQPVSLTMLSKVPAILGVDYLPTRAITRLDEVACT